MGLGYSTSLPTVQDRMKIEGMIEKLTNQELEDFLRSQNGKQRLIANFLNTESLT